MDEEPVTAEQERKILKYLMEWFSEGFYAAGWLIHLEKTIQDEAKRNPDGAAGVIAIQAKRAGGWWVWSNKASGKENPIFVEDEA